jgi:hypothetical protein
MWNGLGSGMKCPLTEEIKYLLEMLTLLYDILAVQIAKYVKGSHTGFLFISILKYLLLLYYFRVKVAFSSGCIDNY